MDIKILLDMDVGTKKNSVNKRHERGWLSLLALVYIRMESLVHMKTGPYSHLPAVSLASQWC